MAKVRIGKRSFKVPENRYLRITVGVLLVFGGMLGFLPVLGFWMIPLGFIVLATDIPVVRRMNRRVAVAVKRWWTGKRPARTQTLPTQSP